MKPTPSNTESPKVAGLIAEFDGPEALVVAAAGTREAGYTRFEAYSPFPVHGIDRAMARRRTGLPWLVLAGGVAGGVVALLLQWWTNAVDYPYEISGKPLFSLPANIPVAFELIVLFAAFAAFGGGLALSRLPQLFHPLFHCDRFRRVTTDAFVLGIEADDPEFDVAATVQLLRSLGASATEVYHQPDTQRKIPGVIVGTIAVGAALALLPLAAAAAYRHVIKSSPRIHPVLDMDFQAKYLPQQASPLFEDGRTMRLPVPGTVAADRIIDNTHLMQGQINGQPATMFPMPVTLEMAQRGRERFDIFCATCHGLGGDGDGIISQRAFERIEPKWIPAQSMHVELVRDQPVGQLYKTISEGKNTMPGYASQIPVADRWAIVLYVRALQRSRLATLEDVPEQLRPHLK